MTKKEQFIYNPETLSFREYWKLALEFLKDGQYIPFYYFEKAARFASKLYSILNEKEKWNKCYALRVKRLAFVWHKYKYSKFK